MTDQATVYIVDDDLAVRSGLSLLLESAGLKVNTFGSAAEFLASPPPSHAIACLILDNHMPEMTGPELQAELKQREINLPVIFLTGHGDIPLAVKTVRAGAIDFLIKPVNTQHLLDKVQEALTLSRSKQQQNDIDRASCEPLEALSKREREVLLLAIEGHTNKEIAKILNISFRTVEHHRSHIFLKTGIDNLLKLARLVDNCS